MKSIIKKIVTVFITLFLVSFFTFATFAILPSNPVEIMLGVDADPLQVEKLTEELGLNDPLATRYLDWIGGLVQGDLGNSIRYEVPVQELLMKRLPVTVSLAIISIFLTLCIVIPVAIFLALNNGKKSTVLFSAISQLGVSIPSFWLGIILILIFAVTLKIFPSGTYITIEKGGIIAWFKSLFLPALSMSVGTSAVVIRYLKTSLLDQSTLDYVRTARSKGLSEQAIMCKHVFKNALLPTITIFGLVVVDVLGGSVIVENVFNLSGIGKLLITGVSFRDFPVVQSLVFYLSCLIVVTNLIVDVVYKLVDPRIRMK